MAENIFKDKDTWLGSFYELALELGDRSDEHLYSALRRVWEFPDLQGCYLRPDLEPDEQPQVGVPLNLEEANWLYGIARMPNGLRVACGTLFVREDDGTDWLVIYMPMGALAQTYKEARRPLSDSFLMLQVAKRELDDWFASLGVYVFREVPFRLGLIGHEVSGWTLAKLVEEAGIPEMRYMSYLWPQQGRVEYFRATQLEDQLHNGR